MTTGNIYIILTKMKYYDRNVLSTVDKKIIQTWSFMPFETSNKDAGIELQSGLFVDKSLYRTAAEDRADIKEMNHMSLELNVEIAGLLVNISSTYLKQ